MVVVELVTVAVLILVNGFFAMAELAVVSSRRARLAALAEEGVGGAGLALRLVDEPGRFLSAVQIGITLVGVLAGAFSGATLADRLVGPLLRLGVDPALAGSLAFGLVVAAVTYLSLIAGELVPKQLALRDPERVAAAVARAMTVVARVAAPAVWLLETSSALILRLMGRRGAARQRVSEEEIKALVAEAESGGTVDPKERQMIGRVLRLGELSVRAVMIPRMEVRWLDLARPEAALREAVAAGAHSRMPVSRHTVDDAFAVVHVKDLTAAAAAGRPVDLEALARQPAFVPDGADILDAMEALRRAATDMAFVVDEHGVLQGVLTSADILAAIVGQVTEAPVADDPDAVRRADGSWLLDGMMGVDQAADLLDLRLPPRRDYHTLAGLVLDRLRHLPRTGEAVAVEGWRLEIVDMDGRRIDKVLATPAGDAVP